MTAEDAERNFEYVELGMRDPSAEARSGLALGLKDTYFDGLETIILDWFTTEPDQDVRHSLLDHMIKQSPSCATYEVMVLEIYEKEPVGSSLRKRMEAAAAGMALYGKFKAMDESLDLFKGVTLVTNKTFNISGNIQGGAVSIGGNAENSGPVSLHYNQQTVAAIQSELSRLERELHEVAIDREIQKALLDQVQAAKANPSPDNLSKLTSAICHVGEVVLAGSTIWEVGHIIARLAGLG